MVASNSNGSQTATITTEHTLGTITSPGVYQLQVDCNAMALGDILELRAKVKVRSTGTTREFLMAVISNVPSEPVFISPAIPITNEIVFTLKQTAGTGRAFPWEIVQVDG
jgi:hypothetical protein